MVDAPVPAEFERGHRSGEVMELSLSSSEMESSKTSKSSEIQLHIQQLVKNYASKLAQLDVTNPEVLRTTHAFCAFQGCAKALRVQCDGDFFHKSFKNDKISTFWSHSWHGAQWKKILTLLSFYNGFAAVYFLWISGSDLDDDFILFGLSPESWPSLRCEIFGLVSP